MTLTKWTSLSVNYQLLIVKSELFINAILKI
jgi:hypothetical protein